MKKILPVLVLLPFTIFSVEVIFQEGYFGFVTLAMREKWALQMLIDLSVSLFLVGGYIIRDAKKHGIPAWPYVAMLPFLGSIGALFYLVHKNLKSQDRGLVSG